jgi:hypothetical protein
MNNSLKHLIFLPITSILWYYVCRLIIGLFFFGLVYIYSLNWLPFLFFFFILVGLVSVVFTVPSFVNKYLLILLYGNSWFSVVCHSLFSITGIVSYFYFLYYSDSTPFNVYWQNSPFKIILMFFPCLGLIIGMITSLVFSPIIYKYDVFLEEKTSLKFNNKIQDKVLIDKELTDLEILDLLDDLDLGDDLQESKK